MRSIFILLSPLFSFAGVFGFFQIGAIEPAPYTFTLDGAIIKPRIWSLSGTPDRPRAGDLAEIGGIILTLGPETHYDFRSTLDDDGRLLLRTGRGPEVIAAVKIGWKYEGDKKVAVNSLAGLTDAEIRGLRGLLVQESNAEVAGGLKRIDPQRTCLTVMCENRPEMHGALPPLPQGLFYLYLDGYAGDLSCLVPLREQSALRFLKIDGLHGNVDVADLKQAVHLVYLDISFTRISHPEALAALKELRRLELNYCKELGTVAFAAGLTRLVDLGVHGAAVTDLSPLSGLDSLARIDADFTRAKKLPDGPLPALRRLDIMSTGLADADVARFAAAHPACEVRFHWAKVLRDSLRGSTRLRVRSDGMKNSWEDETLIEINDSAQIKVFVDLIGIDESAGEFSCSCCGAPIFDFYRDHRLVRSLALHHASSMRCGDWPGHGKLTESSVAAVCEWLAARGVPGPLKEHNSSKRIQRFAQRRLGRQREIVAPQVVEKLQTALTPEERSRAVATLGESGAERTRLCLRLFGCANRAWQGKYALDYVLEEDLLSRLTSDELIAALSHEPDTDTLDGAGRWLFGEGKWRVLDEKTLRIVLPVVARHALGHPCTFNRRLAMRALSEAPTGIGRSMLRLSMENAVPIRPATPAELDEFGLVSQSSLESDEVANGSDRAAAASLLATQGDRESLPVIKRLAERSVGEDRAILQRAVNLLEGK